MTTERWDQLWRLYHGAREQPAGGREAWLTSQQAAGDLLDEVRALLRAQPPSGFLESEQTADDLPDALIGRAVGDFLIEGILGEGGMGTVYLAREHGSLSRPVAIKVVRRGMDTERILRRFRAEQSTLARLDHPSIATVHRSGVTADGRPYFVMQYVAGQPLTKHCDALALNLPARLRVLAAVCDVVQYTHQKGVIHRDLKPSNILAAGDDHRLSLIDFGIAKATVSIEATLTRQGQVVGTPEYMSPEQATSEGDSVDTRTDVYALGRILDELTRELPRSRDLRCIIDKASAVEREQRYDSAAQLALDLRHLLDKQPIAARPASRWYVLRTFLRRHPLAVTSSIASVLILLLLTAVLLDRSWALRAALQSSDAQRVRAEQLAAFMQETFSGADPFNAAGEELTARQLLDRGVQRIDGFDATPEVRAELLLTMANTYRRLGVYDAAQATNNHAIALLAGQRGGDAQRVLGEAHAALSSLYEQQARFADMLESSQRAWQIRSALQGERSLAAESLGALGYAQLKLGRYQDAEQSLLRARDLLVAAVGTAHTSVAIVEQRLASLYSVQQRYEDALPLYRQALRSNLAMHGEQHPEVGSTHNNLAVLLYRMSDFDAAAHHYEAALAVQLANYPPEHPNVSVIENNLGALYIRVGAAERALPLLQRALRSRRTALGEDHLEVGVTGYQLASAQRDLGQFAAADAGFEEALGIVRAAAGDADRRVGVLLNGWAESLLRQRRDDEALVQAQAALAINLTGWPAGHRSTTESQLLLARLALRADDPAQALQFASAAAAAFDASASAFEAAHARAVMGQAMLRLERRTEGRELLRSALSMLDQSSRADSLDLDEMERDLAASQMP